MKRCFAATLVSLFLGSAAHAQPQIGSYSAPVVNPHPVISPYLNLNRTGTATSINYFGLVRPQMDNQRAIQQLQQQFKTTENQVGQLGQLSQQQTTDEIAPTGRGVGGFMNYSHFYTPFNRNGGSAGSMPGIRR